MALDPLICDIYADDCDGQPDIAALIAAGPPWYGLILKATEGVTYPTTPASRAWLKNNWPLTRSLAGARYGDTWFRGAYAYWRADADPTDQATFFLQLVEEAGGWGSGDLWPMIDVEQAGNEGVTAQQVVDGVLEMAGKLQSELGRTPMLYGGSLMYDLGITSHMGCGTLLFPRYTATLPAYTYERIGWQLTNPGKMPTLWGWQMAGDGTCYVAGYPKTTPLGKVDYSAIIVNGGGQAGLDWTIANLGK